MKLNGVWIVEPIKGKFIGEKKIFFTIDTNYFMHFSRKQIVSI